MPQRLQRLAKDPAKKSILQSTRMNVEAWQRTGGCSRREMWVMWLGSPRPGAEEKDDLCLDECMANLESHLAEDMPPCGGGGGGGDTG